MGRGRAAVYALLVIASAAAAVALELLDRNDELVIARSLESGTPEDTAAPQPEQLQCPPGTLVAGVISDYPVTEEPSETEPSAVFAAYLREIWPPLDEDEFREVFRSSDRVRYALDIEGRRQALVEVAWADGVWRGGAAWACDSLLKARADAKRKAG